MQHIWRINMKKRETNGWKCKRKRKNGKTYRENESERIK
jgi:hypothetical protein